MYNRPSRFGASCTPFDNINTCIQRKTEHTAKETKHATLLHTTQALGFGETEYLVPLAPDVGSLVHGLVLLVRIWCHLYFIWFPSCNLVPLVPDLTPCVPFGITTGVSSIWFWCLWKKVFPDHQLGPLY